MPTPPRRRPATPPSRRPKVAGLRRPAGPADDTNPDSPLSDPDDPTTAAAEAAALAPADQDEPRADEPQADDTPADETPADATAEPRYADLSEPALPDATALPGHDDQPTPLVTDGVLDSAPVDDEPAAPKPAKAPKPTPVKAKPVKARDGELDDEPDAVPVERKPRPTPSRRPAGKRKSTGSLVSDQPRDDHRRPAAVPIKPRPPRKSGRPGLNAAIVLAVLALVLAGAALWFKGKADSLTAGADTDNSAVTDVRATEELKNKLKDAIERTLSYDYNNLDATAKAVQETLADGAVCDYNALYGKVKELAPQEKLVLSTKVRDIGVVSLRGSDAEALIFVDQTTTRAAAAAGGTAQTVASGAQFAVRAHQDGGVWKITAFDLLGQQATTGQSTDGC